MLTTAPWHLTSPHLTLLTQVALQEQRADNNAAAARQLKLIERLRADKDALSVKCLAAASELKVWCWSRAW